MSGGRWNYQAENIVRIADELVENRFMLIEIVKSAAKSERIIDYAESGDSVRRREDGTGAEKDLYDLWYQTFSTMFD